MVKKKEDVKKKIYWKFLEKTFSLKGQPIVLQALHNVVHLFCHLS